jgi:polyphosphate glucokinase
MENNTGNILTIDIGGSHIKATILNAEGVPISDYARMPTPQPSTPINVINLIKELVKNFTDYDKISVGFPGYVRDGVVKTAPNLGSESWQTYPLQTNLSALLSRPAKVVNDADLQGIGIASGKGLEMVVTLGTGFGTALLMDGNLLPHFEIAHHPVKTDKDYDEYIGEKAYQRKGKEHWNYRLKKVIAILKTVFNYDRLYISGGNAKNINFELEENIIIANNREGIKGGARLWSNS